MRLTAFRADKGDCLLLKSADGKNLLIDGGTGKAYRNNVAPALAAMKKAGEDIDVLCVSHIDDDHIGGVLELMDDLLAWRIHKFQRDHGNAHHDEPETERPPDVKQIWHNAFHDVIGRNVGEISDMLAASARVLSGDARPSRQGLAQVQQELAQSVPQGIRLTQRVGAKQLNIPLNRPSDGGFMFVTNPLTTIRLGTMTATIIGPFEEDLKNLRRDWNEWLRTHKDALRRSRARARENEEELGASEVDSLIGPMLIQARELGNRTRVTIPNLASLMLLVEESRKSVLLTGDAHWQDVLDGLEAAGKLSADGLHVDVLKVQHHGSEHNVSVDFFRQVTADHYVYSADGAHENPDIDGLRALLDARLGTRGTPGAAPSRRFKVWVTSSPETTEERHRPHMHEVKSVLQSRARAGRFRFALLGGRKLSVEV